MSRGRKPKPKSLKKLHGSRDRQEEKNKKSNLKSMGQLPILELSEIDLDSLCDYGKEKFEKLYEVLNGAKVLSLTDIETLKILADSYAQYWTADQDLKARGFILDGRKKGTDQLTRAEYMPDHPHHFEEEEESTGEIFYYRVVYESIKNPSNTIKQQAWDRIKAMQGEFGLTPASRTKLVQGEDENEDPMDNLLNFSRDKK